MSGIEDVIGDEVLQLLDQKRRRRWAIERLQRAFTIELRQPHEYRGLARRYTLLALIDLYPKGFPLPFGWVAMHQWETDTLLVMPAWFGWSLLAWKWRWRLCRIPMRLGLWRVKQGDYYWNGRVTVPRWLRAIAWCFVNDRDVYPG